MIRIHLSYDGAPFKPSFGLSGAVHKRTSKQSVILTKNKFVIPPGAVASQREATAEWRACPELAEVDPCFVLNSFPLVKPKRSAIAFGRRWPSGLRFSSDGLRLQPLR